MKKLIPLLIIAALAGGGYWYYQQQQNKNAEPAGIAHSNGRLELERMDVASLYAGRVQSLEVEEGQNVEAGALLATLSSDTTKANYSGAEASVNSAKASVNSAKAKQRQAEKAIDRALAQIKAQQQQLKTAQLDVDNAVKLRRDNLISKSELQKRIAARDAAKAQLEAAKSVRNEAEASRSQAKAAIAQAKAVVAQAESQVEQLSSVLGDLNITAPKAGRVQYKLVEVGNVIAAGSKVVSLLDLDDVSMNLFLPAPVVNKVALNSEARIKLDGLDAIFPAKVTYVAADAQFTPKFVETESERSKLMFKVKLKIPKDIAHKYSNYLKGGMTGNGYLLTEPNANWSSDLSVKLPE